MTSLELTNQILALPVDERVAIAQRLWESIEGETSISSESEAQAISIARRRDAEMAGSGVMDCLHDAVMKKARHSIECE